MTDNTGTGNAPTELDLLKARADQMGLKYHPNIGLDTLKERIKEHTAAATGDSPPAAADSSLESAADQHSSGIGKNLSGDTPVTEAPSAAASVAQTPVDTELQKLKETPVTNPPEAARQASAAIPIKNLSKSQLRAKKHREATRLVRVRVTNMNQNKRDWPGEMFGVSNSVVCSIKKYVSFGQVTHVPVAVLNMIKERQCTAFKTQKDEKGNKTKTHYLVPEFGIDILDALTEQELSDLAAQQAASGSVG